MKISYFWKSFINNSNHIDINRVYNVSEMNEKILNYIYNMCLSTKEHKIIIPSIRWFVYKFKLSKNEVVKTFDFFKNQKVFITEQGSKSYVIVKPFLNLFKNDTFNMFGQKIKRIITERYVLKIDNKYEHTIHRQFVLDNKVVLLSVDKIYTKNKDEINLENGVDYYVKNNFPGKKIVQRELKAIDIKNFEEKKIIKNNHCIMTETKIYNKYHLLSHSFSITSWEYFKDFKTEILL